MRQDSSARKLFNKTTNLAVLTSKCDRGVAKEYLEWCFVTKTLTRPMIELVGNAL